MKRILAVALLVPALAMALPGGEPRGADGRAGSAPFSAGERLVYEVEWNPPWYLFFLPTMEAGEAELSLASETEYQNRRILRIIFKARSSGTLVRLAGVNVDDHFEFVTDPDTFCTQYVTKRIREGKRKRDITVRYLPGSRRLHFKEVDVAADPPEIKKDAFTEDVPPCVKDLFSALYYVRHKSFHEAASHRELVGDNDRYREIEVRVEKKEWIATPMGTYQTWRVNTVALVGGLFKDGGQFRIWLTADHRKLPVKFEAKVNLGKVTGKLKELQP